MFANLFMKNTKGYAFEDWENDPLETTASPERESNGVILGYYFLKDSGITEKPKNMPDADWKAYQEWLKTAED